MGPHVEILRISGNICNPRDSSQGGRKKRRIVHTCISILYVFYLTRSTVADLLPGLWDPSFAQLACSRLGLWGSFSSILVGRLVLSALVLSPFVLSSLVWSPGPSWASPGLRRVHGGIWEPPKVPTILNKSTNLNQLKNFNYPKSIQTEHKHVSQM